MRLQFSAHSRQTPFGLAIRFRALARSFLALFAVALLTSDVFSAPAKLPYRAGELIVKEKAANGLRAQGDFHAAHGHKRVKRLRGRAEVVRLRDGVSVEQAAADYRASGRFEFVEPNYILSISAAPNDQSYTNGTLWGLNNTGQNGGVADADIDAPEAWEIIHSASNIIVAVVDSGVRYTHEDLQDNMWINPGEIPGNGLDDDSNGIIDDIHGVNFVNGTGVPLDDHGHGTHVAGILGAVGNNEIGVTGVAWDVQIMALKFLDNRGDGDTSDAVDAIDYAIENGARIINASWGGKLYSRILEEAIGRARDAGVIVVAAAGNDSTDIDLIPLYPASYTWDNMVVVSGVSRSDTLDLGYSSYGANSVDLAAPGSGIWSTWFSWDRGYNFLSGSSMAAPMVSGALALMAARFTSDNDRALIDRLLASTDPLPSLAGRCVTGGRLNLQKAVGNQTIADFTLSPSFGPTPLTVALNNRSIGAYERLEWDLGNGIVLTNLPAVSHIFEDEGEHTITLRLYGPEGLVGYKTRTVSVSANYAISAGAEGWIDPTDFLPLDLGDNEVATEISMPFPFRFYGQSYSNVTISANGLLGFATNQMQVPSNQDIPSGIAPHAIIAPYWDNLNPADGGVVSVGVVDQAPNRKFVVSWFEVPRNGTEGLPMSFQAVLEERTERIVFNYLEVHPALQNGGGRKATVGIKDQTGRVGAKYTFDGSPALLTNGQSIIFTPNARNGLVVTGPVGSGFTPIAIETAEPQSVEYELFNDGNSATEWRAGVDVPWLSLNPDAGIIPPAEAAMLEATISEAAALLQPGTHRATVAITNISNGRVLTRMLDLQVIGTNATIQVVGPSHLLYTGSEGGPFAPSTTNIVVKATGDAPVQWTFSTDVNWVGASPQFGFLNPGDEVTVRVGVSEPGTHLPDGVHTGAISFYNVTGGAGDFTAELTLRLRKPITILASPNQDQTPFAFAFRLTGPPLAECIVQATTNFLQWTPIHTNSFNAAGEFDFVDTDAAQHPRRFYRAIERGD